MRSMRVLLTGGCGFIGSHVAVALVEAGHQPILLDDFRNCQTTVPDRLKRIIGQRLDIIRGDVRDVGLVRSVLADRQIEAVIHLAGLKAVAESVANPLGYYANNVGGMLALLEAMQAEQVTSVIFSSSATVYGAPQQLPIDEDHPTSAANPYGRAKLMCEEMLRDLAEADPRWRVSLLRYFNPVGAHGSGLIGEEPRGRPNNLMPLLVRAAMGEMDQLPIYGTDYPTPDGSAVRDYIHVMDLAEGHVAALNALGQGHRLQLFNLGTGRGTSVLELINTFEQATGVTIPRADADRRPGDVPTLYAATEKAERELGWRAKRTLAEMCADSWSFASSPCPSEA